MGLRRHLFRRLSQIGAYADDVMLVARNINTLKGTLEELEREVQKVELYAKEEKTKYMKVSNAEGRRKIENLNVGWLTFQGVREFKYLGASINLSLIHI